MIVVPCSFILCPAALLLHLNPMMAHILFYSSVCSADFPANNTEMALTKNMCTKEFKHLSPLPMVRHIIQQKLLLSVSQI